MSGWECSLKSHIMGIVWVFSKFTEPPDPQREFDHCWVSIDVVCSSFVGELNGWWWKSFMSSTKAEMVPSVTSSPVWSFILSPLAFLLYVRRHGLHV